MTSRVRRPALLAVFVLMLAGAAWAQSTEVRGVVQRVDVANRTVYFTDNRTVTLDPGARLFVGNREVQLADVQPGWTLLLLPATAAAPAPPVTQSPAPAPAPTVAQPPAQPASVTSVPPAYPAIDATGVVAQVDRQAGTITLQDGRVLHVTGRTTIWQPLTLGSVTPGASVYVRHGEAVDFRPGATAQPAPGARRFQMGTVSSVDAGNARVVLNDGSIVHVRPGTRVDYDGRVITLAELRPGDEVVIRVPAGEAVTVTSSPAVVGGALPRQTVEGVVIEGDALYVVRRAQSP
jgi:Cu/Ag efflux protein CusF